MNQQEIPAMVTIEELRQIIGPERIGRDTAYKIAKQYGVRLGKRYLIPRDLLIAIMEGRLSLTNKKTLR